MANFNRISVIGLGYIGLPTAVMFALHGKNVIGVDINPHIVQSLNQGKTHLVEPQLAEKTAQAVASGKLIASEIVQPADAFIIAVPTPITADHQSDLRAVETAIRTIAPVLSAGNLVVIESTCPVGTTEKMADLLFALRPDLNANNLFLAYCPERVLPSNILQEIVHNDRIIGGLTAESSLQGVRLYQIFAKGQCLTTNSRTAELCKLAENAFRDVNIAFANELSMICDQLQINVWELIALANRHPRVNILQAGAGVGGHCIAVDPWFIVAQTPELATLIRTARQVNDRKPEWVIDKVKIAVADCVAATQKPLSEIVIACFGLAFKADVDDLRESPALAIYETLANWHSGKVLAVEPNIAQLPSPLNATLVSAETALSQADIVVLLVDHQPFKSLHPTQQWQVDTRGIWQ